MSIRLYDYTRTIWCSYSFIYGLLYFEFITDSYKFEENMSESEMQLLEEIFVSSGMEADFLIAESASGFWILKPSIRAYEISSQSVSLILSKIWRSARLIRE